MLFKDYTTACAYCSADGFFNYTCCPASQAEWDAIQLRREAYNWAAKRLIEDYVIKLHVLANAYIETKTKGDGNV